MEKLKLVSKWTRKHSGDFVKRDEWILESCRDRSVLHIGCADVPFTYEKYENGSALQLKIAAQARNVLGVDLESEIIEFCKLKTALDSCQYETVDSFNAKLDQYKFDLIVCGDVIEHVSDVEGFVKNLSLYSERYGADVLLTTINATGLKSFVRALVDKESVHPDHNFYFSASTLGAVLAKFFPNHLIKKTVYFNYDSRYRLFFDCVSNKKPLLSDGIGLLIGKAFEK